MAYQGHPETGEPVDGFSHEHHIWNVETVRTLVAGQDEAVTFFCGGSRNFSSFIGVFDGVFVLDVDPCTLSRRLDERTEQEWGGRPAERELIERLHATGEDLPTGGVRIDATTPIECVVDEILRQSEATREFSI